ncbi:MAG TPA: phosphonoacetaldehyde hydrolase [Bryobacteraceae bacterium]|jgi:phosphonoacetaldehyde hydrolase|nr:phosphonoacetaldehyde hydrolase [Bryobacteraceae bacterium]
MGRVTAVILDWAGTTVDHGSLAPVRTLQKLFAWRGMTVTEEEARRDMGIHKKDHIRALLGATTGQPPDEAAVEDLFAAFIPMQMKCLAAYSAVIPGVAATVDKLRARSVKIGSTTGYTRPMLNLLLATAASQGYQPDCALCPDDTGAGRPWPWMCYLNAIRLGTYPMRTMVKIGDTVSDIEEGSNAGMWTIGIARTGNMIGLTAEGFAALPATEQAVRLDTAHRKLSGAGAHYVADAVADCIPLVDAIEERLEKGERP